MSDHDRRPDWFADDGDFAMFAFLIITPVVVSITVMVVLLCREAGL